MKKLTTAKAVLAAAKVKRNQQLAKHHQAYFKTAPGEYGEGDKFIGLKTPVYREIEKQAAEISEAEIAKLLKSPFNELRAIAAELIAERSQKAKTSKERKRLAGFYWKNRAGINNWNLVDTSAAHVIGAWLIDEFEKSPMTVRKWLLLRLRSRDLWERRIAVISTFAFLRKGEVKPTLWVSSELLEDPQDLIHKATGWMLREMGKRDLAALRGFLDLYAHKMPRTMLRYSIEKMTPSERKRWMTHRPEA